MHLRTTRLQLRPIELGDLDDVAQLLADPEVSRYIGNGQPRPRDRVELGLRNGRRMWDKRGVGPFYVSGLSTSIDHRFVGVGLLLPIARTGTDATDLDARGPAIEIGYWIARSAWRHRYATEIATSVLHRAFRDVGPNLLPLGSWCDP
mgnify:CR=1 FL=1